MAGAQVLHFFNQPAFIFLAGKDFMQQRGADKHHGTQHDRRVRIDTVEETRQCQRDGRRDDRITERDKNMTEKRHACR